MSGIAVYAAVNAVSHALSSEGLAKSRKSEGGASFKFRGIDEVMNALAPLLVANKLIIVPRFLERQCEERTMRSGAVMFYVTVAAEFDFISAEDGSKFTSRTYGEAMDSGDKATNKAMAHAYKYAAFQTFCIPTEGSGDTDADATVHGPVASKPRETPAPQASKPAENPIKSNAPIEAAASVPAASSPPPVKPPSRADAVPTVEATHNKDHSAQVASPLIAKCILRTRALNTGSGNLQTIIAEHEKWKATAKTDWPKMTGIDQRRVRAEQNKLEAAIQDQLDARAPAVSRGDDYNRETGKLREAAE